MSEKGGTVSFDDLMGQLGVRPIDGTKRGNPAGKGKKPSKQAKRAVKAPTPPAPAAAPSVAPAPLGVAAPVAPVLAPAAAERAGPSVAELSAELRTSREALLMERDRRVATEEELERLRGENDALDSQRRGLQRVLAQQTGSPLEPTPPLKQLLEARGLMGQDEFRSLFCALADARQLGGLLPQLLVEDEVRARIFLDDKVALLGDCGACPAAPGRAVLRVPTPRCEVCGGSDIRRTVRQFIDACLLSGLLKVTVVGGSPKYHRQLRELVTHHRLDLDLVIGTARRNARQARTDMDGRDVIILWGGTQLDHSISDLYDRSGRARLLRIPHRGIGGMLAQAASLLSADDPA